MEFWITLVGVVRRTRVIIPAVLVALALGALAYFGTPTSYVSSTTMVLTTTQYGGTESQDPANPTDLTNPMLNFNDSLRTTSAIIIQSMSTKAVTKQLGVGGATSLTVNDGRTNPDLLGLNGPFLYIEGKSTSRDEAERVVVEAQKLMRQKLREWQDQLKAPQKTYLGIADVVPPTDAKPDRARATKLGLLAFLFGLLLGIGIAYFAHQIRARRRARAAVLPAVDITPLPGERPEYVRRRRRAPSPVLVPDDEHDDTEDEPDAAPDIEPAAAPDQEPDHEPAVVSASLDDGAEPAVVPTPQETEAGAPGSPTPLKKRSELAVVPAPVKIKVRSRNR